MTCIAGGACTPTRQWTNIDDADGKRWPGADVTLEPKDPGFKVIDGDGDCVPDRVTARVAGLGPVTIDFPAPIIANGAAPPGGAFFPAVVKVGDKKLEITNQGVSTPDRVFPHPVQVAWDGSNIDAKFETRVPLGKNWSLEVYSDNYFNHESRLQIGITRTSDKGARDVGLGVNTVQAAIGPERPFNREIDVTVPPLQGRGVVPNPQPGAGQPVLHAVSTSTEYQGTSLHCQRPDAKTPSVPTPPREATPAGDAGSPKAARTPEAAPSRTP